MRLIGNILWLVLCGFAMAVSYAIAGVVMCILIITIPIVFPIPQQLQGFGVDDIYDLAQVKPTETMMGADGKLSGGRVPVPRGAFARGWTKGS